MLFEVAGITLDSLFFNVGRPLIPVRCGRPALRVTSRPTLFAIAGPPSDKQAMTLFDSESCRRRAVVEHANTWLDSFKTLLVRYEISISR